MNEVNDLYNRLRDAINEHDITDEIDSDELVTDILSDLVLSVKARDYLVKSCAIQRLDALLNSLGYFSVPRKNGDNKVNYVFVHYTQMSEDDKKYAINKREKTKATIDSQIELLNGQVEMKFDKDSGFLGYEEYRASGE